jgi:hypothetical protein
VVENLDSAPAPSAMGAGGGGERHEEAGDGVASVSQHLSEDIGTARTHDCEEHRCVPERNGKCRTSAPRASIGQTARGER